MDSPFGHRLNTNYTPSDEEIETIRRDLDPHILELERLNERISELTAQKTQLEGYINSHKALISHPRRLPPDILQEIFIACLPTTRNAVMSAQEAPLLLCRICRQWRAVALSTPRLWSYLHLSAGFISAVDARLSAVSQWLQRAAACPITLSLSHEDWNYYRSGLPTLFEILADFAPRYRVLELLHLNHDNVRELADIRPTSLEVLKFTGKLSVLSQLPLVAAPKLRAVTIRSQSSERLDNDILPLPLVWAQLTHITLSSRSIGPGYDFSLRTLLQLFGRCPALQSFRLSDASLDGAVDHPADLITLPSLESLVISHSLVAPSALIHFLELVSMPQLNHFHFPVRVAQGPATESASFFLVPLSSSSPHLSTLAIWLACMSRQSLLATLESFPALTTLIIFDRCPSATDFMNLLTPPNMASDLLCPALQELELKQCRILPKSALDSFLDRRAGRLRRLSIDTSLQGLRGPDLMSEEEIQAHRARGVRISFQEQVAWDDGVWGPPKQSPWTGLPSDADNVEWFSM
ncbi:hypothetical protein R3P38DRAFT_2647635 [Favolaschia claudopus]|uniref:F-box domain-containing protein n=1 Tax=Favolaschia claudopus TaxID=2862362 RepID=A0AAW0A9X6_9AGAR